MHSKEFEEQIARKLVEYGYTIFYRNMKIFYNDSELTELDIISTNFILEVKSTTFTNCKNHGFIFFYSHKLLPKHFKYFVYSAESTDDEIQQLNDTYSHPDYIFINNLESIKEHIPPQKNIECSTEKDLEHFLHLHTNELKNITHLYMPYSVYKSTYDRLSQLREVYGEANIDIPHKIRILDTMLSEKKLVFDKTTLNYVYPFRKRRFTNTKMKLNALEPLQIDLNYYVDTFEKDDMYSKKK